MYNNDLSVIQKSFSVTNNGNETKASMLNRLYNAINTFVYTITLANLHTMYLNEWYGTASHTTFRCDVATPNNAYRFSRMDITSTQYNTVHSEVSLNSSGSGYYKLDGTYIDASSDTNCTKMEIIVEVYK